MRDVLISALTEKLKNANDLELAHIASSAFLVSCYPSNEAFTDRGELPADLEKCSNCEG